MAYAFTHPNSRSDFALSRGRLFKSRLTLIPDQPRRLFLYFKELFNADTRQNVTVEEVNVEKRLKMWNKS